METEAPCPICEEYSGTRPQVEGHISASNDEAHQGEVGSDHREEIVERTGETTPEGEADAAADTGAAADTDAEADTDAAAVEDAALEADPDSDTDVRSSDNGADGGAEPGADTDPEDGADGAGAGADGDGASEPEGGEMLVLALLAVVYFFLIRDNDSTDGGAGDLGL